MEKVKKSLTKYKIVVSLLLLIPAVWALFVGGFYGASDDIHIAWLYEMDRVIKMGQIPPRFVPDLSFGFGYPLFNFVFPLPFYISEIFHLLGMSLVDSIKTLFFLSIPLSFISMYYFLKKFTNSYLGILGGLIYVYTPYRATDLYIRGAIGEIWAFALLPLIALSVVELGLSKKLNPKWIAVGGLSLGCLILTHNITAYMFFPMLIVFWVILLVTKKGFLASKLINFAGFIAVGLLSSLYFWLPAILESKLFKYDTVFNYKDHFPTIKQLVTPYFGYGASVPGPYDGMSFFIGTINLVLATAAPLFLFLFWRRYSSIQRGLLMWALAVLAFAVFMMNYRSSWVWDHFPLIGYFQFPWRFLILTTFTTPLFVILLEKLPKYKVICTVLIALTLLLNFSYFRPQDFLGRSDKYFLDRYIPVPQASAAYLETREEYLRLPVYTNIRPEQNYPRVFPQTGITQVTELNGLDALITTYYPKELIINYNKYYYPGWSGEIDGKRVELSAAEPFGQVSIKVPEGKHTIKIYFSETNQKRILDIISLLAIIFSFLLIFKGKLKSKYE